MITALQSERTRPALVAPALLYRLLPLLLLLASLYPLAVGFRNEGKLFDDAYITMTYAKSLAAGEGWRYNGEPVALGTTTPLFAMMLALLGRLLPVLSIEQWALALGVLAWLGSGWLLFAGHRAFGLARHEGAFLAIMILLQGWWYTLLGMETSLFLWGLLATLWLAATGRARAAGAASVLLFLIRPSGLAMVPLVGLYLWWQERAQRAGGVGRFLQGALPLLLLWSSYAWLHFGSLLPHTVTAKYGQGHQWDTPLFANRLIGQWLPGFAASLGPSASLSLLWILLPIGIVALLRSQSALRLLLLWLVLYLGAFTLLRAPAYIWYVGPVWLLLTVMIGLAPLALLRARRPALRLVGAGLLLLLLLYTARNAWQVPQQYRGDQRATTYHTIAQWFNNHAPPHSTIAFVEIGYLGYFTEHQIIDLLGLTRPDLVAGASEMRIDDNFWHANPDYFLYQPAFDWLLGKIVADPRFARKYKLVATVPGHLDTPFYIYRRLP